MDLIVLTVVVIALLIAVLAIFLFVIGVLLNRTADNLGDCVQNVKNIGHQAEAIGPAIERINEAGGAFVGALPVLCDAAERIGEAKSAPFSDRSENTSAGASPTPFGAPAAPARGLGYLDGDGSNFGYLDA